jgi:putative ABC transport system permease protein
MVNISDVDGFKKLSNEFFKKRLDDPNWKTEVTLMSDDINYIVDIITLLTYIITIIAVASMIIGGIGIMNITIVNINERTREIGIKKAVGAGNSWIIFEFLTEAVLMSLSGALIGVVTGIISSFNIANIIKIICKVNEIKNIQVLFYIPYSIIVFSIFFSIITGIIFGIIPALKTTKMNVIDALRME